MQHKNQAVQQALTAINDALCEMERNTGNQSVLILRDQSGFEHRSMSGKPIEYVDGLTDEMMFDTLAV